MIEKTNTRKKYERELTWLYGAAIEVGDIKTAFEILRQAIALDIVVTVPIVVKDEEVKR